MVIMARGDMEIDRAIYGAERLLASPKTNPGLKASVRARLERLKEAKRKGVKEVNIKQYWH